MPRTRHAVPRGAVLQVSGPPCAGKSTRLRELAEQYPAAVILDDWAYHRSLGTPSRDRVPPNQWDRWYDYLDTTILRTPPGGLLAYIQGSPVPRFRGIRVDIIDPGIDVCHARADADNRPPITHRWIDQWYHKHRPRSTLNP